MKKDWMVKESQLDKTQQDILMATLEKSCVIKGCAGSGKSVLALIKAQHIQKGRGNDYQMIVFTKALRSYMNTGVLELGLGNNVSYYYQWKHTKRCPSSEYTIVDEIQDFDSEEIAEFVRSTKKTFFFFGDTAQSIYEGIPDKLKSGQEKNPVPVERIREIPSIVASGRDIKEFKLYYNYRLPLPVARVAQYVGVDLDTFNPDIYKSQEKEMPRFLQYEKFSQLDAIHRIIGNRNLTDVAILLPDNSCAKEAYERLSLLGTYEVRREKGGLDFTTPNPKIMTYWSAKGLQFESVFLPWVESLFSEQDSSAQFQKRKRKALYVAMTRTYRDLYVLYDGVLPAPLSDIDSSLYKTTEADKAEDI